MTEEDKNRTMHIPDNLYRLIKRRAAVTGFGSVDEYVMFILQEIVAEDMEPENIDFNKQDEEEVKKRLKDLGYM
jgi:hypothetical protein